MIDDQRYDHVMSWKRVPHHWFFVKAPVAAEFPSQTVGNIEPCFFVVRSKVQTAELPVNWDTVTLMLWILSRNYHETSGVHHTSLH